MRSMHVMISEETELQSVPGRFESFEEYVRVFEPLLFEECRAQLYSTWEELSETTNRDAHMMVRVKIVERRERGKIIFVVYFWKLIFFFFVILVFSFYFMKKFLFTSDWCHEYATLNK